MAENSAVKKNSILKDALVLLVITLIAGLLLGLVYQITLTPINARKMEEKLKSYQAAYPAAVSIDTSDSTEKAIEIRKNELSEQGSAFGNNLLDEVLEVRDENDALIGYVASVTSKDAYKNQLTVAVGMALDGTVQNIAILASEETAGLGAKASEESFTSQYAGKNVEQFTVTKSGASAEGEIDAISGATITSNAVTNAVNEAVYSMKKIAELSAQS